ncbi:putative RNA-directed DNA polymerase from transposon BS [Trichonephila clavipes]|nr:putative RNA-directed DNA polymerase from transposon BS [Trichonephila clavipes]
MRSGAPAPSIQHLLGVLQVTLSGVCQMTGTLPPLLDSVAGGGTPGRSCMRVFMDPMLLCPGNALVLLNLNIDDTATCVRFLLISLPNNGMSKISLFAIHRALIGIGEPKSAKRLRSGDLLIETKFAVQRKSFLLVKSFINSPVTISPHKTLNSCCGAISEPDMLSTPEAEILEGFSNQGVIQFNPSPFPYQESTAPTSNNEHFNASQIPKRLKQNSKNRKMHVKEQKAEIEIKLTLQTPKKSYVHHTSEDEDMIVYNIEEDENFKEFINDGYTRIS